MGQLGDALHGFQRWLELDPSAIECLNWLSLLYRRMGDLDSARRVSSQAVELQLDDPDSLNNLGLVYLAQQNVPSALAALERAVQLRPTEAQFRHNLGIAQQRLGDDGRAAQSFQSSIQLAPRAVPSYLSLGELTLAHGDPVRAFNCARSVLQLDPNSVTAMLLAARALTNLDRGEKSEAYLRSVIKLDTNNSIAHAMLGFRLQFGGRFEPAEASFRKSLELNSHQGLSHWGLRQGKRATEADVPELGRLQELAESELVPISERAYLYYTLGKSWADLKRYAEAFAAYERANLCGFQTNLAARPFARDRYQAAFDRTSELFTAEFIERHRTMGSESNKPIFIVGMMRSGTTLMEQILSSHPEVAAGGELQFWLERAPGVVDINKHSVEPGRAGRLVQDYLNLLNGVSSERRVTDKMPQNIQVVGLIRILFPNAKIINLNRNPVDTCLSIFFTPYEFPPEFAYIKENIAFAYRQNQRITEHWRRHVGSENFFDVTYEELIDDSESVIRSVLDFCELPWDERCLRHDQNARAVNTPSVWQVRQPIYKTSRDQWKKYEAFLGPFKELA